MKGTGSDFFDLAAQNEELTRELVELAARYDFEFEFESEGELDDAALDAVAGGTMSMCPIPRVMVVRPMAAPTYTGGSTVKIDGAPVEVSPDYSTSAGDMPGTSSGRASRSWTDGRDASGAKTGGV